MRDLLNSVLPRLLDSKQDFYLHGLRGSSKALVAANLQQASRKPVMMVTHSFEQAERLRDDIFFFMGKDGVHFFPHWDTLPYDSFSPHREIVAQRFETLKALCDKRVKVLITTPLGLMQKVMPKSLFIQNCMTVKCNEEYPPEKLIHRLQEAGYTLVDMVEEKGEYSVREELIDIFPINISAPVRLEWNNDTLVSIKGFDVQTQLSEGSVMQSLEMFPAQEVLLNPDTVSHAQESMLSYQNQVSQDLYKQMEASLQDITHFPGIESVLGLFYKKPQTLFDYCGRKTLLILDEMSKIQEKARNVYDEVFVEYELCRQQGNFALSPELLYLSHQDIDIAFNKYTKVSCFESSKVEQNIYAHHSCPFLDNHTLRMEGKEAHHDPHSSVVRVINRVKDWKKEGGDIVFTAKNQTHADHFRELLSDFGIQAEIVSPQTKRLDDWWSWLVKKSSSAHPIFVGSLTSGFRIADEQGKIPFTILTEAEIFGEKARARRVQKSHAQQFMGSLDDLQEGDYVVHLDYGIGQYQGLKKITVHEQSTDFMVLTYARNEKVYVPVDKFNLVQKYINADGSPPKLNKLGEKSWKKTKSKVAKAVEDIANELVEIYAARKAKKGFKYSADNQLMMEFELAFPYEETEDQLAVINEVKQDLESETPMDRLVCGDVGFGKTEIAMRAAFKAVIDNRQVCMLVPTTILAQQHAESFKRRFEGIPVNIDVISRFRTPSEQRQIVKKVANGETDILIGTHRLLSADVKFKDLGILIVDEEQRFGVRHKEKIKRFRTQVDVLTLSATPIPRTLHMSLMGIRDLSLINTPPADRLAVRTRFLKSNDHIIQEAVSREVRRGGQVFVVHNRVETIFEYAGYLKKILPNVKIAVAHGQMGEHELERIMMDFINAEYEVLVSTTIIESGLDIPKANTILVNNAYQFGLAQLYQLRGRVGRSNVQAYAYLLVPADKILSNIAQERLKVLQELNDLGVGFKIASRDLELRGAGNLLGSEQSGHIASVGMELYTQMVDKAVKQLQQEQVDMPLIEDIKLSFNVDSGIPEEYIRNTNQRLSLYKKLAAVQNEEELWKLRDNIENRFGHLPDQVLNLFKTTQARLFGYRYGLTAIEHRQGELQVQIGHTERLDTEKLISWLQQPSTPIRFVPEKTLVLTKVPNSMNSILDGLRSFGELFPT